GATRGHALALVEPVEHLVAVAVQRAAIRVHLGADRSGRALVDPVAHAVEVAVVPPAAVDVVQAQRDSEVVAELEGVALAEEEVARLEPQEGALAATQAVAQAHADAAVATRELV